MWETSDELASIRERADDTADGCHWRAEQHAWSENYWRTRARWFGFGSSFLAALGGAGSIGAAVAEEWLGAAAAGAVAVLAATFSAYNASFEPAKEAERHRVGSSGFTDLRARYRDLAKVPPEDVEAARTRLEDLASRKAQLESDSPAVELKAREALKPSVRDWLDTRYPDGLPTVAPPEDLP